MNEDIVKLGIKGQIVIKKEFRDKLGLHPGMYVEAVLEKDSLRIRPIQAREELEKLRAIRASISKAWPKGVDSVSAVREQRG